MWLLKMILILQEPQILQILEFGPSLKGQFLNKRKYKGQGVFFSLTYYVI